MCGKIKSCAIIGAGPSGLMAAGLLSKAGCAVTVYEKMPTAGRKFLMAGIGGLNLTHSEDLERFCRRYRGSVPLPVMVQAFTPDALRSWCESLGESTFTGTSGRVFPAAFKASSLLRAWLQDLTDQGVRFRMQHEWMGWLGDALQFQTAGGVIEEAYDAVILALGGASWPRLGSDGAWQDILRESGTDLLPLHPSNCGFVTGWDDYIGKRFAGVPLKSAQFHFAGESVSGEAVITRNGLEGGAVYALSALLRDEIEVSGGAVLIVDWKPALSAQEIEARLSRRRKGDTVSNRLRKAGLSAAAIAIMREGRDALPDNAGEFAQLIKATPVRLTGVKPLEKAISTAGGIAMHALTDGLMLKARPGVFAAGEMLDWEAPTGGYLLQGCFASAYHAAKGALDWMGETGAQPQ